ncbi:Lrp/AsnC family transcriptional regulator [Virgibacillus byunsanensis]|uniref:Lrp/AsnC family transcriptional regulator n=1 Tax=Virgibacillus byunsanensis TaxID=570945 RepID=A0ABW3LNE1_9BACI
MIDLSDLDIKLLKELQKDGKKSYTHLAEQFDTTVATVSNRVQRLMDQDVLKIVGVVNPIKTGNPFVCIFGMKVPMNKQQSVIDELHKIKDVRYISSAVGTFDIFVEVVTSSNIELYRIMREEFSQIEGIEKYESSILLEVHKQSYEFGANKP